MIRSKLLAARRDFGMFLLGGSFPRFAPRCGCPSRGLRVGRPCRLFSWGPLAEYKLLGGVLISFAFRLLR